MRGPGGGYDRYSPLKAAHERILTEKSNANAREMTDIRVERADREPRKTTPAMVERSAAHPPRAAGVQGTAPVVIGAPAPGETQAHFVWRGSLTARLAQEQAARQAQDADRIARVLRTEKSPHHRRSELKTAMTRLEENANDTREQDGAKEKGPGVEPDL